MDRPRCVINLEVIAWGGVRQGETVYVLAHGGHTQCRSGLGRRRRRRGHLRRRRVGHERLEGVELLLGRRRSKLGMCLNREAKNQHGLRVARRTTPERLAEGTQTYVTAKIDFCG